MTTGLPRNRFDFGVLILLAALAGCAHEEAPLTVPRVEGRTGSAIATTPDWRPSTTAGVSSGGMSSVGVNSGGAIDAIIYANLSNDEMLRRLAPYIQGLGMKEGFEKSGGPSSCIAGPGATACNVPGSGLELIYDPNGALRVMRRLARTIGGRSYSASPLTGPGFEWNAFRQRYGY